MPHLREDSAGVPVGMNVLSPEKLFARSKSAPMVVGIPRQIQQGEEIKMRIPFQN